MSKKKPKEFSLQRTVKHTSKFGGATIVYTCLPKAEADAQGIEYEYWKTKHYTGMEEGLFYVLSDDDIVVPIYAVSFTKYAVCLRSAFGIFLLSRYGRTKEASLIILPENRHKPEDYMRHSTATRDGLHNVIAVFAARGLSQDEIVASMCQDGRSRKAETIRKFYKSEEANKMIREEVRQILNNCDITEEKVVRMLMDAHQTAKDKRDVSNMLRSVENLIDIFGLKDKLKETRTDTIELGSEVEDLERLENVRQRIKLTQKHENE